MSPIPAPRYVSQTLLNLAQNSRVDLHDIDRLKLQICVLFLTQALVSTAWNRVGADQTAHIQSKTTGQPLSYLLYLPDDYASASQEQFPILLYLHGDGEEGADLEKVEEHGPLKLIKNSKSFPMLRRKPTRPLHYRESSSARTVPK